MSRIAIYSAYYYISNRQMSHKETSALVTEINKAEKNLEFSDYEKLTSILKGINTRLIDRQSLSLQAAIKQIEEAGFYKTVDKTKVSVVSGSFGSAAYPTAKFVLSAKEKGVNLVNASEFPNTVGNAAASRVCIWNQFTDRVISLSEGRNSGIDAIVSVCDDIKYGNIDFGFACATEEIGVGAFFVGRTDKIQGDAKPLAYVERYDSRYIGGEEDIKKYLQAIIREFNIKETDFYISGDFKPFVDILNKESINTDEAITREILSLAPMLDIGRSLCKYEQSKKNDGAIISIDEQGFVGLIHLKG